MCESVSVNVRNARGKAVTGPREVISTRNLSKSRVPPLLLVSSAASTAGRPSNQFTFLYIVLTSSIAISRQYLVLVVTRFEPMYYFA